MAKIFGFTLFAVRFLPALMGGVMIIMVASLAKELGGSDCASLLAVTGLSVSVFFMRSRCHNCYRKKIWSPRSSLFQ
jgi:4-amino-4-deoxy-L-arabinose transferase-like glycosyltransferase